MKYLVLILTLVALPVKAETDLECLTENIYHEARGEGLRGWVAVGKVTLNRVNSKYFPDSVCEVVYQKYQFSWTNKKVDIHNEKLYSKIKDLAHTMLHNDVVSSVGDSLYYHADVLYGTKKKFVPYWAKYKIKVAQIGRHIFYRRKP